MNDLSLPRRFLKVSRNFGLAIAVKVTWSKVRGMLFPALALPDGRAYEDRPRQVSFLLDTVEHAPGTMSAVAGMVEAHGDGSWEICVCDRPGAPPETLRLLARLRGTRPWIRIVKADAAADLPMAARWTVEQATGAFIALVAPHDAPDADAVRKLLDRMRHDEGIDAAILTGTREETAGSADCRLAMQRKSRYLESQAGRWPLSAAALAQRLPEAGTACVRAG